MVHDKLLIVTFTIFRHISDSNVPSLHFLLTVLYDLSTCNLRFRLMSIEIYRVLILKDGVIKLKVSTKK